MTRKEAREYCFKLMFQYEVQKSDVQTLLSFFEENELPLGKQSDYIHPVLNSAVLNIHTIDEATEKDAKGWRISRLPKVTLAVLRVAITEILYMDDVPDSISINEAVEIAKSYGDEKNGKFVNGILASVLKDKQV